MDTVAVAERLHNEGMNPVPHLAARSLRDTDQLDTLLAAYTSRCGVNEVLVIGGGVDHPVGAFSDSMQVLETGLIQRYGIQNVGLPVIQKAVLILPRVKLPTPWRRRIDWPNVMG